MPWMGDASLWRIGWEYSLQNVWKLQLWIAIRRFLGRKEKIKALLGVDKSAWLHLITWYEPGSGISRISRLRATGFGKCESWTAADVTPVEDPASVERVMFAFDGVRFEVCELGGDIAECFLILVASRSSAVHLPAKARSAVCVVFCSLCIDWIVCSRCCRSTLWKNVNYSKKFAPNCWHFSPFQFVIQLLQFVIHAMKMWASDVIAEMHQLWIFNFQLHSSGSFRVLMEAFSFLGRTLWLSTHCLLRIEALELDCTTFGTNNWFVQAPVNSQIPAQKFQQKMWIHHTWKTNERISHHTSKNARVSDPRSGTSKIALVSWPSQGFSYCHWYCKCKTSEF